MFIRILFHIFSTLAIATIGFGPMPATAANPASIRSSHNFVSAQTVAAAETPAARPSTSPSSSVKDGSSQNNAGPSAQPVSDQDSVTRLQIYLDEHSFGPGKI